MRAADPAHDGPAFVARRSGRPAARSVHGIVAAGADAYVKLRPRGGARRGVVAKLFRGRSPATMWSQVTQMRPLFPPAMRAAVLRRRVLLVLVAGAGMSIGAIGP